MLQFLDRVTKQQTNERVFCKWVFKFPKIFLLLYTITVIYFLLEIMTQIPKCKCNSPLSLDMEAGLP